MSFLKVKRKCEQDPKEVFVLASKKSKLDDLDDVPVFELTNSSIQGNDIDIIINNTIKSHPSIKTRTIDFEKLRSKLRADNAERAREKKLKILNHIRKLDSSEESVPIIDLGDDAETDENGNKFVYDLYYSSTCVDLSNAELINDYCLQEVNEELYVEDESKEEFVLDDEEDSNDENCWKNEYPDETDEDEDDSDDFLANKMEKTQLNSDYSLSSDEFDEDVERNCYSFKLDNRKREDFDYYDQVAGDTESD